MIDTKAMEAGRYPIDEFRDPASRTEAHPTLAAYLQSRTDDELCAMVWNDAYRHNIFGTYSGYSIDLARDVGAEFARRATPSRNDILEEAARAAEDIAAQADEPRSEKLLKPDPVLAALLLDKKP